MSPLSPEQLIESVLKLRACERDRDDERVTLVRRQLELAIGPTVRRAVAARVMGVTAPALNRWIHSCDVPLVMTLNGRYEVPVAALLRMAAAARREPGSRQRLLASHFACQRSQPDLAEVDHVSALSAEPDLGLAYHQRVAQLLDRSIVADACDRLARWQATGAMTQRTAQLWHDLLDQSIPRIAQAITECDANGHFLRQSSPFAGSLSHTERARILQSVQAGRRS